MYNNNYFADEYEGINYTADEKYADGYSGISSDLGGYVSTYIENRYGGAVALWLIGAADDQGPLRHYPACHNEP